MKQAIYFDKEQQNRRSKEELNSSVATRLDTPNADSIETTRIHSNLTMNFQTYTQNESNQYQNNRTQSRGVGR